MIVRSFFFLSVSSLGLSAGWPVSRSSPYFRTYLDVPVCTHLLPHQCCASAGALAKLVFPCLLPAQRCSLWHCTCACSVCSGGKDVDQGQRKSLLKQVECGDQRSSFLCLEAESSCCLWSVCWCLALCPLSSDSSKNWCSLFYSESCFWVSDFLNPVVAFSLEGSRSMFLRTQSCFKSQQ